MQANLLIQNSSNLSADTVSSTKQQFQLQTSIPFFFSSSRENSSITQRVPSKINWSNQEKEKYSIFVFYFRHILKNFNREQLKWNIFKGMSMFIRTKNPHQCRSYHLKLLREFNEISIFLTHSLRRIHRMQYKMTKVQIQLHEIQDKLNLYFDQKNQKMDSSQLNKQISTMILCPDIVSNQPSIQKLDTSILIKTADCYTVQQNPTRNNYSNFSNLLTFLPTSNKLNYIRSYLPSFDCDDSFVDSNRKLMKFSKLSQNLHNVETNIIENLDSANQKSLNQNRVVLKVSIINQEQSYKFCQKNKIHQFQINIQQNQAKNNKQQIQISFEQNQI